MKKFLSLLGIIFLLNRDGYACQDSEVVNNAIAKATSAQEFREKMQEFGGVKQIMSSGNFHETPDGWKRFQKYLEKKPLNLLTIKHPNNICYYQRTDTGGGILDVILNKTVAVN